LTTVCAGRAAAELRHKKPFFFGRITLKVNMPDTFGREFIKFF